MEKPEKIILATCLVLVGVGLAVEAKRSKERQAAYAERRRFYIHAMRTREKFEKLAEVNAPEDKQIQAYIDAMFWQMALLTKYPKAYS